MAEIETLTLTTAHAVSSYGLPVLVLEGEAYGAADMTPAGVTGAELVDAWAARFKGARFTGQLDRRDRAGELQALLQDLWAGAMIGADGAGFVNVSPDVTARVVAALQAAAGHANT